MFDRDRPRRIISNSKNVFSQYENMSPTFKDETRLPWLQEKIPPISSAG
jgi:hypothetical protein